jgi:hypothetical protein
VRGYIGAQRLQAQGLLEAGSAPELPDILGLYWTLERMHWAQLPWPGGLSDQPHQLMFELDCVDEAIQLQKQLDAQFEQAFREGQAHIPRGISHAP